jgi:serine/threonine-protein kinase HipA
MPNGDNIKHLIVTLYGNRIGQLTIESGKYIFSYGGEKFSHPLSLSLPFGDLTRSQKKGFSGKYITDLPHYFENLLPEGWLLSIAKDMKIPQSNKLEILYHLCRDTMGAVSFEKEGSNDDTEEKSPLLKKTESGVKVECRNCMICGKRLAYKGYNDGYHERCSLDVFGSENPPGIGIDGQKLESLAMDQLSRSQSVTGAQVKLSLIYKDLAKTIQDPGLAYIIKPQMSDGDFSDLPVMEHITMRFAERLGLVTAKTAVIITAKGRSAFLTRRFDRESFGKLHCEDFSQASLTPKGDFDLKYLGSYELMGKILEDPLIDPSRKRLSKENLFKSLIFNYLIGNTDAHLKNHSIIWDQKTGFFKLAPFYDLVPNKLYCGDTHDIGLKLKGSNIISKESLEYFAERLSIDSSITYDFMEQFRSERTWFLSQMKCFGIKEHRIESMMDIVSQAFRKINSSSNPLQIPSEKKEMIDISTRDENATKKLFKYCQNPQGCENPKGPTRLKGIRKKLGICSFCKPDIH